MDKPTEYKLQTIDQKTISLKIELEKLRKEKEKILKEHFAISEDSA